MDCYLSNRDPWLWFSHFCSFRLAFLFLTLANFLHWSSQEWFWVISGWILGNSEQVFVSGFIEFLLCQKGMLLFLVHLLIILIFIKVIFVIISKMFHVYWQLNFVTVVMLDRCIYPIVCAPSYYIYLHVFSLIVFPLFFMCTNRVDLLCLGSGFDRQVIVAKDFLNVEILPMLIKQEIG